MRVGGTGQECLQEWARLVKLSAGPGGIGQEGLGMVGQNFCRNEQNCFVERMSAGVGGIG